MQTLNFMFGVHVLHRILKYCKSASDCLQTEDLDLAAAVIGIADLTRKLHDMRTDAECRSQYDLAISKMQELSTKFPDFLQSAEAADTDMDTVQEAKRSRKVPKRLQECVNDNFWLKLQLLMFMTSYVSTFADLMWDAVTQVTLRLATD